AQAIFHELEQPFAAYNSEGTRDSALMRASLALDHGQPGENVLRYIESLEPNIPWTFGFLRTRSSCYTNLKHPAAADAQADLLEYLQNESGGLESAHFTELSTSSRV